MCNLQLFLLGSILLLHVAPVNASETLYGIDRIGDNLITIDTATGAGTIVGPTGFDSVDGLDFDPETGILYGVDNDTNELITIDTATGTGKEIGPIGTSNLQGLAFGPGGILYAVDLSLDYLLTINTSTGAATVVGALLFSAVSSLAYDASSGILYGVDYVQDQLITIDTVTGKGTAAGTAPGTAGPGNVSGLAFSSDGTLFAADVVFDELLTIDTNTGTASAIGPLGFGELSALAFSTDGIVIGGSVSGLEGSGLVLQNKAGDDVAISDNGSFTFATLVSVGSIYAVTVLTHPTDPVQACSISNGAGTVGSQDITDIVVNCRSDEIIMCNGFESCKK